MLGIVAHMLRSRRAQALPVAGVRLDVASDAREALMFLPDYVISRDR